MKNCELEKAELTTAMYLIRMRFLQSITDKLYKEIAKIRKNKLALVNKY